LDGDEGRVGHGPRGEGGMAHPGPLLDPPLLKKDLTTLAGFQPSVKSMISSVVCEKNITFIQKRV